MLLKNKYYNLCWLCFLKNLQMQDRNVTRQIMLEQWCSLFLTIYISLKLEDLQKVLGNH